MSISLRHFTAIGLTTALVFGVFQHFYEFPINTRLTTSDMILFILVTFFGPLAIASFVMFPIVATFSRLLERRRKSAAFWLLAVPAGVPVILLLLYVLTDTLNGQDGPFLTLIANVLFVVLA